MRHTVVRRCRACDRVVSAARRPARRRGRDDPARWRGRGPCVSSVSDGQPRSPAAPGDCSATGGSNVLPPSRDRAVLISVAVPRAVHETTISGGDDPLLRSERHARRHLAVEARLAGDRVDLHAAPERRAAIAADGDEDVGLAVGGCAPRDGDERAALRRSTASRWRGPANVGEASRPPAPPPARANAIATDQRGKTSTMRSRTAWSSPVRSETDARAELERSRLADGGDLAEGRRRVGRIRAGAEVRVARQRRSGDSSG